MTEQIEVNVQERDGTAHTLTWRPDQSLMEVIRDGGLPISAECGGSCACATCHVHLDARSFGLLAEPDEYEAEMLEEEETFEENRSRLACQVRYSSELAGLTARIAAPDEMF